LRTVRTPQPLQPGLQRIALVAGDDGDARNARLAKGADHAFDDAASAQTQQRLEAPHARRVAGGQHERSDGGHGISPVRVR
jgi:hypothetical protein